MAVPETLVPTITDQWSDGKRLHVIGTINYALAGNYIAGGAYIDFAEAGVRSAQIPKWVDVPLYRGYFFEYTPGTDASDGQLIAYGSGDAAATGTLTSDNVNVGADETVTIGTKVYTFKAALTPAEGEVLIGAAADDSMQNLIDAINHTGTPDTQYKCAAANADVSAGALAAHAFAVTALVSGSAGNAIASTETSAHLSWGGALLTGGVDSTAKATEITAGSPPPTDLQSFDLPFYAVFEQYF